MVSPAYARSEFGEAEWRAAFVQDPSGEHRVLIPVRVQTGTPPGMLRSRVYIDLVDCDEDTVLVKAERLGDGNVCHTGERTCFFQRVEGVTIP